MSDIEWPTELRTELMWLKETIGAERLKKSSAFIRNVDDNRCLDADLAETAYCCVCDAIVDTRAIEDGGDTDGCQMDDGAWVCSSECWDADRGHNSGGVLMGNAPERIWFTEVDNDIVPNSKRTRPEDVRYDRADLAAPSWQDIETAPKDKLIDIWLSDGLRWCDCYHDGITDTWRTCKPSGKLHSISAEFVTHWMHRPAAPIAKRNPENPDQ